MNSNDSNAKKPLESKGLKQNEQAKSTSRVRGQSALKPKGSSTGPQPEVKAEVVSGNDAVPGLKEVTALNVEDGVITAKVPVFFLREYGATVAKLKGNFSGDERVVCHETTQTVVAQLSKSVMPCLLIASALESKDVVRLLNILKVLKEDVRRNRIKFIVFSKISNPQIIRTFEAAGCHEFVIEPVSEKSLMFKMGLQIKALFAQRKHFRDAELRKKDPEQSSKSVDGDKGKKSEEEESSQSKLKTIDAVPEDKDEWVFSGKKPAKTGGKWTMRMKGPDPSKGDWIQTGTAPDGSAQWRFLEKENDGKKPLQEEAKKKAGWEWTGDQPTFNNGEWGFQGEAPDLSYLDESGQKQASKVKSDGAAGLLLARDSDTARESILKQEKELEAAKNEKKKNLFSGAGEAVGGIDLDSSKLAELADKGSAGMDFRDFEQKNRAEKNTNPSSSSNDEKATNFEKAHSETSSGKFPDSEARSQPGVKNNPANNTQENDIQAELEDALKSEGELNSLTNSKSNSNSNSKSKSASNPKSVENNESKTETGRPKTGIERLREEKQRAELAKKEKELKDKQTREKKEADKLSTAKKERELAAAAGKNASSTTDGNRSEEKPAGFDFDLTSNSGAFSPSGEGSGKSAADAKSKKKARELLSGGLSTELTEKEKTAETSDAAKKKRKTTENQVDGAEFENDGLNIGEDELGTSEESSLDGEESLENPDDAADEDEDAESLGNGGRNFLKKKQKKPGFNDQSDSPDEVQGGWGVHGSEDQKKNKWGGRDSQEESSAAGEDKLVEIEAPNGKINHKKSNEQIFEYKFEVFGDLNGTWETAQLEGGSKGTTQNNVKTLVYIEPKVRDTEGFDPNSQKWWTFDGGRPSYNSKKKVWEFRESRPKETEKFADLPKHVQNYVLSLLKKVEKKIECLELNLPAQASTVVFATEVLLLFKGDVEKAVSAVCDRMRKTLNEGRVLVYLVRDAQKFEARVLGSSHEQIDKKSTLNSSQIEILQNTLEKGFVSNTKGEGNEREVKASVVVHERGNLKKAYAVISVESIKTLSSEAEVVRYLQGVAIGLRGALAFALEEERRAA